MKVEPCIFQLKTAYRYFGEEGIYIIPNTSFLGDSTFKTNYNDFILYNSYGFNLFFRKAEDFGTWTVYEEQSGAKIQAAYNNFTNGEILPELEGSYAIMNLTVIDSFGNEFTNHPLHHLEIKVSEDFGVMNPFYINHFKGIYYNYDDDDFTQYDLSALKTSSEIHGTRPRFADIFTSLEVGTETHITWGSDEFYYEEKRIITDKIIDAPYVTYVYENCVHQYTSLMDTIYRQDTLLKLKYDTYVNEVQDIVDASDNEGFLYTTAYGESSETSLYKAFINYKKYYKTSEFTLNNINYWGVDEDINYSMGTSASHLFIDGIGDFIPYRGESGDDEELVYYKTPYDEWGTPLEFSCPNTGLAENQQFDIRIFPMPAEEVIQIQSPLKIDRIQFYDLQGRLVKSEDLNGQTSLDVSSMEKGVYLIEIYSETKLLDYQKIMIQ